MLQSYGIYCPMCGEKLDSLMDDMSIIFSILSISHDNKYEQQTLETLMPDNSVRYVQTLVYPDNHVLIYHTIYKDLL